MKKLCSCLLIATISLGQFGVNGYALKKNTNSAPRVAQEKVSWLRENFQKNNANSTDVKSTENKINDVLSKEQTKNKKKAKNVTNVNIDLKGPVIAASVALAAAVALSIYSDFQGAKLQKEMK